MKRRIWLFLLSSIVAISGFIVLSGYFFPLNPVAKLGDMLLHWFVIVAAMAMIAGGVRLTFEHGRTIYKRVFGSTYSWIFLISLAITVVVAIIFGQVSSAAIWMMSNIILPSETSLMALLAVFLVDTLARSVTRCRTVFNTAFTGTSLLLLTLYVVSLWTSIPWIIQLNDWIRQIWSLGAIRALLVGVALGAVVTGMRILIGSDRPFES